MSFGRPSHAHRLCAGFDPRPNPILQIDALKAAGCKKWFEETASGARRDWPRLAAALDDMREGDTLVVWKLDRLARLTKPLIETVEAIQRRGVGFKCLTQDIDTTTAGGRLIFTIFSAIAEFEREIIHERTRAALKWKRAQNQRVGQVRYGYRLAEDGVHEEADEREQALIAAALALRAEGTSLRRIGQHLKRRATPPEPAATGTRSKSSCGWPPPEDMT